MTVDMADNRTAQHTECFISVSLSAPKLLLTNRAKPLFSPKAIFVIRLYSAAVAPIWARAVSPRRWPASDVSARL